MRGVSFLQWLLAMKDLTGIVVITKRKESIFVCENVTLPPSVMHIWRNQRAVALAKNSFKPWTSLPPASFPEVQVSYRKHLLCWWMSHICFDSLFIFPQGPLAVFDGLSDHSLKTFLFSLALLYPNKEYVDGSILTKWNIENILPH